VHFLRTTLCRCLACRRSLWLKAGLLARSPVLQNSHARPFLPWGCKSRKKRALIHNCWRERRIRVPKSVTNAEGTQPEITNKDLPCFPAHGRSEVRKSGHRKIPKKQRRNSGNARCRSCLGNWLPARRRTRPGITDRSDCHAVIPLSAQRVSLRFAGRTSTCRVVRRRCGSAGF
jgi:hypothetical protein